MLTRETQDRHPNQPHNPHSLRYTELIADLG